MPKFKFTVSGDTPEQIEQNLAYLYQKVCGGKSLAEVNGQPETRNDDRPKESISGPKERKPRTPKADTAPSDAEMKAKAEAAAPAPKVSKPKVELDYSKDIRPLITQIGDGDERMGLGRPAVLELLAKFGVQKGPDLKEEHFEEFKAEAEELLATVNGKGSDDLA